MALNLSSELLTTRTNKISRKKCFVIDLYFVSMLSNTKYDVFLDGINVNAFCKPFGKNLGDSLISSSTGIISANLLMDIEYDNNYASLNAGDNVMINKSKLLEVVSPSGVRTGFEIPIILKPTK